MTKPIKPGEITEAKKKSFPEPVIEAWNNLIIDNWNGHVAHIKQNKAVAAICSAMGDIPRSQVFDMGYLDIEDTYRSEGWKVYYDKPGYNESYEAYFEFRKK